MLPTIAGSRSRYIALALAERYSNHAEPLFGLFANLRLAPIGYHRALTEEEYGVEGVELVVTTQATCSAVCRENHRPCTFHKIQFHATNSV